MNKPLISFGRGMKERLLLARIRREINDGKSRMSNGTSVDERQSKAHTGCGPGCSFPCDACRNGELL